MFLPILLVAYVLGKTLSVYFYVKGYLRTGDDVKVSDFILFILLALIPVFGSLFALFILFFHKRTKLLTKVLFKSKIKEGQA